MKNTALKTAALISGLVATSAFAQGETGSPATKSGATFWIDHDVLTWESENTKPDEGDTQKSTQLRTNAEDVTIGIFWNNYGLRVRPDNPGAAVDLSLFPNKDFEVGIGFGTQRTKTDTGPNETEVDADTFAFFGNYYLQIDAMSTIEFGGRFSYTSAETDNTGTAADTESKRTVIEIGAQYAYQIAEHFHIIPGIVFNTGTEKEEGATPAAEEDNDLTGLKLQLVHFRYVF